MYLIMIIIHRIKIRITTYNPFCLYILHLLQFEDTLNKPNFTRYVESALNLYILC